MSSSISWKSYQCYTFIMFIVIVLHAMSCYIGPSYIESLEYWPNPQIPQCTSSIPHKATFCIRNVHVCTSVTKWCIVGHLFDVLWDLTDGSSDNIFTTIRNISILYHYEKHSMNWKTLNQRFGKQDNKKRFMTVVKILDLPPAMILWFVRFNEHLEL